MVEKIRVILPKKYDLVVGDTFQMFYRSIIEAPNPYVYSIVPVCEIGRVFPRYFDCTPTQTGDYALTVSVYDAARNLIGYGETMLHVVEAKEPKGTINILTLGDSLTAGSEWLNEFKRRITEEGGTPEGLGFKYAVNFVGTHHVNGISHEAHGGWAWTSYVRNFMDAVWVRNRNFRTAEDQHSIWQDENGALWMLETLQNDYLKFIPFEDHTSPMPPKGKLVHVRNAADTSPIEYPDIIKSMGSPFYDPETKQISVVSYAKRNNIKNVDAIIIFLGANGLMSAAANSMSRPEYCQYIVNGTKELVAKLREAYPNAKIKLMSNPGHSVNGGMGVSYGATLPLIDIYEISYYKHELDLAYQAWCLEDDYKDFMEYVDLAGQFDCEYSMLRTMKKVNTRSDVMECVDFNGAHPSMVGYMQIADAIYRNFISSFCSK